MARRTRYPVARPADWVARVNRAQGRAELGALRESVRRDRPYGEPAWVARTADRFGLASLLRPAGRGNANRKTINGS